MSYHLPARTARRRTRSAILAVLVVVGAMLLGVLGFRSLAGSSSAASPIVAVPSTHGPHDRLHGDPPRPLQGDRHHAPSVADGEVPDGVTVFDDEYPALANLDPALLGALRQAATDAGGDGVAFYVSSGWRSRKYQEQLFRKAVSKYGSKEDAARWVALPGTSAHELGKAVDLEDSDATAWLSQHGAKYGLCQIYSNEPWHYELRPEAVEHGCPRRYADPTHDPRMQR